MKPTVLALIAFLCATGAGLHAAGQPLAPYKAVEVDRFVSATGVAFPLAYQGPLVDDIAREMSLAFPTAIQLREGDAVPDARAVLRISGIVTQFKAGSRTKRSLIGFGADATIVMAQVKFTDATTGRMLLNREVRGTNWTGIAGGDSQRASDSLARKIVKLAKAGHLFESQ